MNKNFNIINFLIPVLVILLSSGKSSESKENSTTETADISGPITDHGLIKLVDNNGVGFKYELGNITEFGENFLIDIECLVTNNTDKEINYLRQSCNGLDYYLIMRPNSYKIMPLVNCNGTWAMISKLSPRGSLKFRTQILKLKGSKPISKIGLDFRAVDKSIPFDILREHPELVDKIYRSHTEMDQVIWGNKK